MEMHGNMYVGSELPGVLPAATILPGGASYTVHRPKPPLGLYTVHRPAHHWDTLAAYCALCENPYVFSMWKN